MSLSTLRQTFNHSQDCPESLPSPGNPPVPPVAKGGVGGFGGVRVGERGFSSTWVIPRLMGYCVSRQVMGSPQGGAALVLALMVTGFLLLLGSALLTMASSERQIGLNDQAGAQALYLAEAAVERARSLLPRYPLNDVLADNRLLGEWVHGASLGSGTYQATVTNNIDSFGGYPSDVVRDGCVSCDTDGLVVVTGTGSYQGAIRVVRTLVEVPPILSLPAPLTLANAEIDPRFEGESFTVSGFDRNVDGSAGSSVARHAIAVLSTEAASYVRDALTTGQQSRLLGADATPSIEQISTAPTSDALQRLKHQVARQADRVLVNPGTLSENLVGAGGEWQTTVMKGDPSADRNRGLDTACDAILEGTGHGAGVLVVTGELTIRGSYRFDGLILLVGDGSRLSLEGDAVVIGSVIVANRTARYGGKSGVTIRDRAQLHWSHEALQATVRLLSATTRVWQEVSEQ